MRQKISYGGQCVRVGGKYKTKKDARIREVWRKAADEPSCLWADTFDDEDIV